MRKEQVTNYFTIALPAGGALNYVLNNSREIEICTDAPVQEAFENNKIVSLTAGNFVIKIGDNFKHELTSIPSSYQIKFIDKFVGKKFKNSYVLSTHPLNLTSQYIIPCLGLTKEQAHYNGFLVNAYLMETPDKVALLYRFSTSEAYGRLEETFRKHKLFDKMDNSIEGFDLVIMNVPKEYHKDVVIFSNGGYSKISPALKQKIVDFHGLTKKDYIHKVMFKDPDLQKKLEKEWDISMTFIELAQRPNMQHEALNNQIWIRKDS